MRVWKLRTEEEYDIFWVMNEEDKYMFFDGFNGKPMLDNWKVVELVTERKGKEGDMLSCDNMTRIPIFTKKAIDVLQDLLEGKTEVLPLKHSEYDCYAINIINAIDCLDYDKAKLYQWGTIKEYAFIYEKVKNQHIFFSQIRGEKFPNLVPLVSDEFRQRVIDNGLEGFKFKPVWDSDPAANKKLHMEKNPIIRATSREDFKNHIEKYYGTITELIKNESNLFTEVDLYVIGSNKINKYNTITTFKNSYLRMMAPPSLDSGYAELVMHLPKDWEISVDVLNHPVFGWPLRLLRSFGNDVMRKGYWLGQWFVFPNLPEDELKESYKALFKAEDLDFISKIQPYDNSTEFCGVMVAPPITQCADVLKMEIDEEGEWPVYVHTLLPLYKEEIICYYKEGRDVLLNKLMKNGIEEAYNLKRKNTCN